MSEPNTRLPMNDAELTELMANVAARLKFTMVELMYVIGRFRSRPVNPLNGARIAAKLGIEEIELIAWELMIAKQVSWRHPDQLEGYIAMRDGLNAEQARRLAMMDKLREDYVDPTLHPRIK